MSISSTAASAESLCDHQQSLTRTASGLKTIGEASIWREKGTKRIPAGHVGGGRKATSALTRKAVIFDASAAASSGARIGMQRRLSNGCIEIVSVLRSTAAHGQA